MEHVVFFPAPDGAPAFLRVATIEEAVRLVEHLRNSEGIAEVAVHPLGAEVPLAFRAYYRVEVPAAAPDAAAPEAEAPADAAPLAVEPPLLEPVAVAVPAQPTAVEDAPQPAAEPVVEDAAEPAAEEGAPEPTPVLVDAGASNGHAADGVKSLGFFA